MSESARPVGKMAATKPYGRGETRSTKIPGEVFQRFELPVVQKTPLPLADGITAGEGGELPTLYHTSSLDKYGD